MPWCDTCDRFLSPSTVLIDGTCPVCGRAVDAGKARAPLAPNSPSSPAPAPAATGDGAAVAAVGAAATPDDDDEDLGPIPWHLKLLAAALAVYLGYRAMQGIEWVLGK